MQDGSVGCHHRVQKNKSKLNVQKTIEIQVSHFHRRQPPHPLLNHRQQGGSVIRETSLKQGELFFRPHSDSDLNGGGGQRARVLINKVSHYYKIIIGTAVSIVELTKLPRIIISDTKNSVHHPPTKQAHLKVFFLSQLKTCYDYYLAECIDLIFKHHHNVNHCLVCSPQNYHQRHLSC